MSTDLCWCRSKLRTGGKCFERLHSLDERSGRLGTSLPVSLTQISSQCLDVLDQTSCAVGNLLGSLDKMLLGHWVASLATGYLTGIAKNTGVLSNHCSSS